MAAIASSGAMVVPAAIATDNFVRSELALALKPLIAEQAKVNQQARKGDRPGASLQKSADLSPVDTRAEIAKAASVSHDTIAKVERIKESAAPEVIEAVRARPDHPCPGRSVNGVE